MNVINGRGGLPMVQIQTPWSAAEIYLQGASITHFQLHGEPPLLLRGRRERREPDDVADGVDALDVGAELLVDLEPPAPGRGAPGGGEVEAVGGALPPRGVEDAVGRDPLA